MPLRVTEFSTTDPEAARDLFTQAFTPHRSIAISGPTEDFSCSVRFASGSVLGVDWAHHTMTAHTVMDPLQMLLVSAPSAGRLTVAGGRDEALVRPGEAALHLPGVATVMDWVDIDLDLVRLSMDVVDSVAAEAQERTAGPVRFLDSWPVSRSAQRSWLRLNRYLQQTVREPGSDLGTPLIEAATARLVAAHALRTFPNTVMTADHVPEPRFVAAPTVRRAVEFIESHAGFPVSLSDIAQACHVSPRALQIAFRRHHGVTPMQYLRRVRLHAAHQELSATDPATGETVASIARRHGFGRSSRFADSYRRQFGELPGETLRTHP